MKLIVTRGIQKKELKSALAHFPLSVIKKAAQQACTSLSTALPGMTALGSVKKVYLTGPGGAGRSIFLLIPVKQLVFLVMICHKNDKKIGENMSPKNKDFVTAFLKNIDLILQDWQEKAYEEYELQ